jgi:hypothetical protein
VLEKVNGSLLPENTAFLGYAADLPVYQPNTITTCAKILYFINPTILIVSLKICWKYTLLACLLCLFFTRGSVADRGCLSPIPDPRSWIRISDPRSQIPDRGSRIPVPTRAKQEMIHFQI